MVSSPIYTTGAVCQCAHLCGLHAIDNNRMSCKHAGECYVTSEDSHGYTVFILATAYAEINEQHVSCFVLFLFLLLRLLLLWCLLLWLLKSL